ncbi:hypothetical protein NIES267_35210 [Calothrix parasitica NIES-267]|uniref:Uncharacterized protein n=1 Tax=Calothrix parasitica NIES-267 TaxID=1973488 RepID=A0A1Z4LS01_9CYAN|nr:hypothetical protein NIES267_35210 [Calothrix parasitica NIES-267]
MSREKDRCQKPGFLEKSGFSNLTNNLGMLYVVFHPTENPSIPNFCLMLN